MHVKFSEIRFRAKIKHFSAQILERERERSRSIYQICVDKINYCVRKLKKRDLKWHFLKLTRHSVRKLAPIGPYKVFNRPSQGRRNKLISKCHQCMSRIKPK
jgi:hypothetical protein